MVQYKIDVKTGDYRGAGTDAEVYIVLYGGSIQTAQYRIGDIKTDNFDRNRLDSFTIESTLIIPQVKKIELWRINNGRLLDWYLESIEITILDTGVVSKFPVMKWIEDETHHFFNYVDTCLPQNDPFKEPRAQKLKRMQEKYILHERIPGGPAQLVELPEEEEATFDYGYNTSTKIGVYQARVMKEIQELGLEWNSIEEVRNFYFEPFRVPDNAKYFNDDAHFGRQRLCSINSLVIKLCKEIPDKLGVTDELMTPFLEGKSVQEALDKNRLFIVDHEVMEGIPTKGPEYTLAAPIALFYFNDENKLMPIAIQLYQQKGPDNPVFTPADDKNTWLLAKLWFNNADAHVHNSLTHFNFNHWMLEGVWATTKRQMSSTHPIFKILKSHYFLLFPINYIGKQIIFSDGGFVDMTSSGGHNALFHLVKKGTEFYRLDVHGTLPENMKARGVLDPSILAGAYHFRDDALLLFNAIKNYVTNYVNLYYVSKESLLEDNELQAWGAELVQPKTAGGLGMSGVPNGGKFETTVQLINTLTPVIYGCSVGHAAANFQKYDEVAVPFSYPYRLHGTPPKDKSPVTEEFLLKTIPNRQDILTVMTESYILTEKVGKVLGFYEKEWNIDPAAVKVLEGFQKELQDIEKQIEYRNQTREPQYTYLKPSGIPNAMTV